MPAPHLARNQHFSEMSKSGKEITLPVRDASGRCVDMCGGEGIVYTQFNDLVLFEEEKGDEYGWLFTHLTFIMYCKPGSIQIARVAQTKTNMFLPSKSEQPSVKGKLLALRLGALSLDTGSNAHSATL